jgi:hypothetical protein
LPNRSTARTASDSGNAVCTSASRLSPATSTNVVACSGSAMTLKVAVSDVVGVTGVARASMVWGPEAVGSVY